jgi:pyridoxal phosphate enzyme (YggS family)
MTDAEANLASVRTRIADAAAHVGRDAGGITLIVVSKTFAPDAIEPVLRAGQRDFGENRVQEAAGKWPELRRGYPDVRLHLIGPLQTKKAREAVALFDAIHSLDRDRLARALATEMARQGRAPALFVQVNTGGEAQKSGVAPEGTEAFVRRCREEHGLSVEGLMCLPPIDDDPAPHFETLARLARSIGLRSLSMGMSGDFEKAVELGATHVRVGSAIFGERAPAR